ncbi:MAG TPA: STAS domain-containing protein [Bacteroidota bacterium]|nr:STAS domain-containing protein [Bacteroidota bacterium]
MFDIRMNEHGDVVLSGRLDAAQTEKALEVLNKITKSVMVDFKELDYISSAGLGVLLATQKRLSQSGNRLKLINMNSHIKDVFHFARFDMIFEIQ